MIQRINYQKIWQELDRYKNMTFIAGPRQAGKTTFAKKIAKDFPNSIYFNWDNIEDKGNLIKDPFFFQKLDRKDSSIPLVILDEIHKYKDWKNYVKGIYDKFSGEYKFLVTGSGRLDIFQRGGDSLAGRYVLLHLWPFTLSELSKDKLEFNKFMKDPLAIGKEKDIYNKIWQRLSKFSGFPEPYVKNKKEFYRIWSTTYQKQLLREDIRNMAQIKHIDNLEILFSLLPDNIGSLLSLNNLAQTIGVAHASVKNWLNLFERYFLIFRISPWRKSISRSIVKEKKLYLFNYASLENKGKKFENMVAVELFSTLSRWNNLGKGEFGLYFLRNKGKEEVDFLITKEKQPFLLIECKLKETKPSKSLIKFQNSLKIPAIQLVNQKKTCQVVNNGKNRILVINAASWLAKLP